MQEAYVVYSTLATEAMEKRNMEEGKTMAVSTWADQVMEASSKHNKYVTAMIQGHFYDGIEQDPRKSSAADDKLDLKTAKGAAYTTAKTFIGKTSQAGGGSNVQPI